MRGTKKCPNCGTMISGCRTKFCTNPNCKAELISSTTYSKTGPKTHEEQKQHRIERLAKRANSVKVAKLPKVNEDFYKVAETKEEKEKPILHAKKDFDWHTLEKGDIIKVAPDSGPYWITDEGEKILMNDHGGMFRVTGHTKDGIQAIGIGKKSGQYFLWMNGEKKMDTGIIRSPHRILKVKKSSIDDTGKENK